MADGSPFPQPASIFANFPSISQINAMQPVTPQPQSSLSPTQDQPTPTPPPEQPASGNPFANFPTVEQINAMPRRMSEDNVMQMIAAIPDKRQRAIQGIASGLTPMVSSDNTSSKLIPPSQIDEATQQGYLPAIMMTSPDGKAHLVAHDQTMEAIKQGWQPGQLPQQKDISQVTDPADPRYGSDEWYASKMPQPVVDGLNWLNEHFFKPKAEFAAKVADIGGQVARRTVATAVEDPFGSEPLTMQQLQQFRQEHPGLSGISYGAGSLAGGMVGDPTMWPLMFAGGALPVVQKLASLGFSTQMLYGAYKTYPEIKAAADRGDVEGVYELLTNLGLSAYLGAKGVLHATGTPDIPIARLIDPLSNMSPGQIAVRATKPSVGIRDAGARVDMALPYSAAAADKLGIDTDAMGKNPDDPRSHTDALAATREAKRDVWDTLQTNHLAPAGSFSRDVNPVADAIDSVADNMDPIDQRRNAALVQTIRDAADDYRDQQMSVQDIESRIERLNNELSSQLSQRKVKQDVLRADPEWGWKYAELESLRGELQDALDSLTGPGAQHLKQVYGALKTFETILENSRGVAERASPVGLFKGLGRMSGFGNILSGGYDIAASPFAEKSGAKFWGGAKDLATGLGQIWYGKQMQKLNDRNFLLGEAFRRANRATLPGRNAWVTPQGPPAPPPQPTPPPTAARGGGPTGPPALPAGQYGMPPSSTERPPGPQLALPPAQGIQAPASSLPPPGELPAAPERPQLPGEVGAPPLRPQLGTGARETPRGLLGPARLPASISGERAAQEAAAARGTNVPAWTNLGHEPLASRPLRGTEELPSYTATQAAKNMATRVDEGGPDRAAAIHLDDNAYRLLATLNVGPTGGQGWRGINMRGDTAQRLAGTLENAAHNLDQQGETESAANARTLANQLNRVVALNYDPAGGHAGVPLIRDPGTLSHEAVVHAGQRSLGGGEGDIAKFTDIDRTLDHPAVATATRNLVANGYANKPPLIAAEMQAHILDGNHEALGLNRAEAVDFMKHSLDVLAEHHGADVMENLPRLAQRYVDALREYTGGEGGETRATEAGAPQPERAGRANASNAPPSEAAEGAAGPRGGASRAAGPAPEIAPAEQALASRAPSRALSDEEAEDWRISTRRPTPSTKDLNRENPMTQDLQINRQAIRDSPPGKGGEPLETKLANRVSDYVGQDLTGTPQQKLDQFHKQIVDNLIWLHNQLKPEFRARAKLWYDSANKLAADWAEKYNLTHQQVAAIIASLSPQKDWNMNVSLAQRMIEGWQQHQNTPYSEAMAKKSKELAGTASLRDTLKAIRGKKLGELTEPVERAMWIRLRDEAHDPQSYQIYAPEGGTTGVARNQPDKAQIRAGEPGDPSKLIWHSNPNLVKALSIIEDGSRQNISDQLGEKHKVRNFYNNIIAPNSNAGDVTIDTHAVAAAHLRPLAGPDPEVSHNFGSGIPPGKNLRYPEGVPGPGGSAVTGVDGTYGLYADAYRAAAKKLGLSPRELQSITWEGIRSLFPAEYKAQEANKDIIDGIWSDYTNGKIPTIGQTRKAVVKAAGGFKPAEWENPVGGGNKEVPAAGLHESTPHATRPENVSGSGIHGPPPGRIRSGGGAGSATRVSGAVSRRVAAAPSPVPAPLRRVIRK